MRDTYRNPYRNWQFIEPPPARRQMRAAVELGAYAALAFGAGALAVALVMMFDGAAIRATLAGWVL